MNRITTLKTVALKTVVILTILALVLILNITTTVHATDPVPKRIYLWINGYQATPIAQGYPKCISVPSFTFHMANGLVDVKSLVWQPNGEVISSCLAPDIDLRSVSRIDINATDDVVFVLEGTNKQDWEVVNLYKTIQRKHSVYLPLVK